MFKIAATAKKLTRPAPDSKLIADILLLIIFGPWLLIPVLGWVFAKPNPNAYKCGGPGFADFGCAGGWESVVATIFGAIFLMTLFFIVLIVSFRLVYRYRNPR